MTSENSVPENDKLNSKADAMNDQTTKTPQAGHSETPPTVAEGGTPMAGSKLSKEEVNYLRRKIVAALKTVKDPEIPVDIYELGLIYTIDVTDEKKVRIDMTLTAPNCPVAGEMPGWVHDAVSEIPEVKGVGVNMVFDPPWDQNQMSDEARLELGMF